MIIINVFKDFGTQSLAALIFTNWTIKKRAIPKIRYHPGIIYDIYK
jgi:hypothetical protein